MSDKSSKTLVLIVCLLVLLGILRACSAISQIFHEHKWQDATCTEPRTCSDCGDTDGEPLGHDWQAATCVNRKTCRRCSATEGSPTNHTWTPATCTEPEACSSCGKKRHWYALSLGHDWVDATCTAPKTCSLCGTTEGEPQHFFVSYSWDTTIEATCQNEGEASHACKLCGAVETKVLPVSDHKAGKWETVVEATPSADGTKKRYCEWCGLEIDSMQYKYLDLRGGGTSTVGNGNNFNTYNNESQQNTSATYVLNTSTMKFHLPLCRDVPRIAASNYATSSRSRSDLISSGYSACGHCNP